MNWVKNFALLSCLAVPLAMGPVSGALADPAAPAAATPSATDAKPAMTPDEKKAKAADCSKQADAKKLHGEARRKFRSACKKG